MIESHEQALAKIHPAAVGNTPEANAAAQADTARAAAVLDAKNDAAKIEALWSEAQRLKQSLGNYDNQAALENEWAEWRGKGRDSLAVATAARDHYAKLIALNVEHARLGAEALYEAQAPGRALAAALPARTAFANQRCQPYFQIGADLKALAAQIELGRPTPPPMHGMMGTAPIGTPAELDAALNILASNLNALTAAVAKARSDLKVAS